VWHTAVPLLHICPLWHTAASFSTPPPPPPPFAHTNARLTHTHHTHMQVFIASDLIQGWQEGVHLMTVGDSYEFIIPPALGYGAGGAGGGAIPGHAVLVFRLELNGYDEIGDEFIDKTIWRVIVTCRRKIYKGVELWQVSIY